MRDNRVVLFDHVGAGGSDFDAYSPRRYQSLHSYANDMLELLSELDIENAIYVGHSMGGMIGLLAAKLEPERFQRAVVIGASPRYLDDVGYQGGFTQAALELLYNAMATSFHAWASGAAPLFMGNPDRAELSIEFAKALSGVRPDIGLSVARIVFQSDHRADLPDIEVPTLVVQTKADIVVPLGAGEFLAKTLPYGELRVIDADGHLPHLSAPNEVITAIRSVLN